MTVYKTPAETTQAIREALKTAFPDVKFSVRKDRGGGAGRVTWTDGPSAHAVETIAHRFQGKGPMDHTDYAAPVYDMFDGEQVHWGLDYVFCTREVSDDVRHALETEVIQRIDDYRPADGVWSATYEVPGRFSYELQRAGVRVYERSSVGEIATALAEARARQTVDLEAHLVDEAVR
jgi:hypothetical protein